MGVTRAAPWWLTWALLGGLVLIFLGERVLAPAGAARAVASGLGALVVIGCLLWRLLAWRGASGEARQVDTTLLAAYAGVVLALVLYLVSSADDMRWLGIEFASDDARVRYQVGLQVLWPILMAVSLLPALGAQIALAAHRHARAAGPGLEAVRVRGTAKSALTIALAGAFLFVTGYVTSERDRTLDASYFKTSSPGTATVSMVAGMREPLRVLLFFPDVDPVKDEALRYFRALAAAAPGPVGIEAHDRLASPAIAREHRVTGDGTVLFLSGEQSERLVLPTELRRARAQLRRLDGEVQQRLMSLLRERRTVYLTAGHGELNDTLFAGPLDPAGLGGVGVFRQLLRVLHYDVRELGLRDGLGRDVPEDAAVVAVLGPRRPFLPEELSALDRYLARGGSLLLALEPESEFRMGPLESRLGVRFVPEPLADDVQHLRQRGGSADRRLIVTDRFSSHAAVTTASRAQLGAAVLFAGAGHLEEARPDADDGDARPRVSFVVRSLPSTFADLDGTFEFDERTEERRSYNLVAAVEAPVGERVPPAAPPEERDGDIAVGDDDAHEHEHVPGEARAMVFADADVFTDPVIGSLGLNAALVADAIRWLGREEELAGAPESEEDVPILHTRAEDVAWFYSTILGAPALILALGLLAVLRRRRRHGGWAS